MMDKETYITLRKAISRRHWSTVDALLLKHERSENDRRPNPAMVVDIVKPDYKGMSTAELGTIPIG